MQFFYQNKENKDEKSYLSPVAADFKFRQYLFTFRNKAFRCCAEPDENPSCSKTC